jgi:peptide/nickel transport system permease protein
MPTTDDNPDDQPPEAHKHHASRQNPDGMSGLAWFGATLVAVVGLVALFAPWLAPYELGTVDVTQQLHGPSWEHPLGTDQNGADLLTQVIYGSRVAMIVGVSVVTICSMVGIILGAISGYAGGAVDEIIMRLTDLMMAFPGILLAILLIFIVQEPGLFAVIGALSATGWAGYARLVRGEVLSEREETYVEAANAIGYRPPRILFREILPNVLAPVIVQATFGMAGAILAEASLSFLGLGPQDVPSWGGLLHEGANYFLLTPHLAIFPGIAIMLTIMGLNFLGDGLRDWLDPRGVTRTK